MIDDPAGGARAPKIPESVLVVIHTAELEVLLIERADRPGYWQSVTGSKDAVGEPLAETAAREVAEETGIVVGSPEVPPANLRDWERSIEYEIYPMWRHRYAEGVTRNIEHRLRPARAARHRRSGWRRASTCGTAGCRGGRRRCLLLAVQRGRDPRTAPPLADASFAILLVDAAPEPRAAGRDVQHPQGRARRRPAASRLEIHNLGPRHRGARHRPGLPAGSAPA